MVCAALDACLLFSAAQVATSASGATTRTIVGHSFWALTHYWIVDPQNETLTVLRWTPDGYLAALTAGRTDRVRAKPFDAVELPVGVLFGDDEE